MRTLLGLLGIGFLAGGCAGLPALVPLQPGPEQAALIQRCERFHPRKAFRAVHAIEATLPMDQASSVIGASLVDPAGGRFRAVLMSVEGLTLFDALASGTNLTIYRAVPPLDEADFGLGLMDDVALALLPPRGGPPILGTLPGGRAVCRSRGPDGGVIDLLPAEGDAPGTLQRYDPDQNLVRRVVLFGPAGPLGLAGRILLTAPGVIGYHLELKLLEASALIPSDDLFSP